MSYTPPTPTLPEGEELEKILQAHKTLGLSGPFMWAASRVCSSLFSSDAGRQCISTASELRFRDTQAGYAYLRDADEFHYGKDGSLDNPAAIALASAWMVPLLVAENKRLREQLAQHETSLSWSRVTEFPDGSQGFGPYSEYQG